MIQQKGGEVQSKEVSVQTNIPVPNSFEEKKPDLIKREILNKQLKLESSISKNIKLIKDQKNILKLKEQLNDCLSLEVIEMNENLLKIIKSHQSFEKLNQKLNTFLNNLNQGRITLKKLGFDGTKSEFLGVPEPRMVVVTRDDYNLFNRQKREFKKLFEQTIEKKKSKYLKEINEIISISNKLVGMNDTTEKLGRDNQLMNKSIQKEKLLNNLPNQTYGSVIFYNELNKNSTLFDNYHLNKITRFLNFIETHEDKYLGLYDRCVGLYIDDPNNNCFNELINKLETINHYYEIMKSLINNVNKDKVLYNKLYNLIEDEGIFMTKTEKESLNYMKKVSTGIISLNNNIVDGFIHLSKGLNELTMINTDISNSLYDIDSSLGMINSSLDDIYFNLPDNRGR